MARAYRGPPDLRAMQEMAVAVAAERLPSAYPTAGDLAWWRHQHARHRPAARIRLWHDAGDLVAWGWLDEDSLYAETRPGFERIRARVIEWARTIDPGVLVWTRVEADAPAAEVAIMTRQLAQPLPVATLPARYRGRHLRGVADIRARVAVHRAAFAPSRVTEHSYRNVMAAPPYRPDLDWIVEAPDGAFAAFCLAWLDDANRLGTLEPVGAHPAHRRRGAATAACLGALGRLALLGADTAVVCPPLADGPAVALYRSLGFRASAALARMPPTA